MRAGSKSVPEDLLIVTRREPSLVNDTSGRDGLITCSVDQYCAIATSPDVRVIINYISLDGNRTGIDNDRVCCFPKSSVLITETRLPVATVTVVFLLAGIVRLKTEKLPVKVMLFTTKQVEVPAAMVPAV